MGGNPDRYHPLFLAPTVSKLIPEIYIVIIIIIIKLELDNVIHDNLHIGQRWKILVWSLLTGIMLLDMIPLCIQGDPFLQHNPICGQDLPASVLIGQFSQTNMKSPKVGHIFEEQ